MPFNCKGLGWVRREAPPGALALEIPGHDLRLVYHVVEDREASPRPGEGIELGSDPGDLALIVERMRRLHYEPKSETSGKSSSWIQTGTK